VLFGLLKTTHLFHKKTIVKVCKDGGFYGKIMENHGGFPFKFLFSMGKNIELNDFNDEIMVGFQLPWLTAVGL
jgi:hypothetical protein